MIFVNNNFNKSFFSFHPEGNECICLRVYQKNNCVQPSFFQKIIAALSINIKNRFLLGLMVKCLVYIMSNISTQQFKNC